MIDIHDLFFILTDTVHYNISIYLSGTRHEYDKIIKYGIKQMTIESHD